MSAINRINFLNATCGRDTTFDEGWSTHLQNQHDVIEPTAGQNLN